MCASLSLVSFIFTFSYLLLLLLQTLQALLLPLGEDTPQYKRVEAAAWGYVAS